MRVLRAIAAVLLLVLAILLAVVAVVLCLTVVLLPLGLIVGYAAIRVFTSATKLLMPRTADLKRGARKSLRVREVNAAMTRAQTATKRVRKRVPKRIRKWRRRLPV
jgi:hypothetical protein